MAAADTEATLTLTGSDATLVALGLSYLILDRRKAGHHAEKLPEPERTERVERAEADLLAAERIKRSLDAVLFGQAD